MFKILINTIILVLVASPSLGDSADVEPIQPINPPRKIDPRKVTLGYLLFNDPRLSKTGSVSCASCHNLSSYGVDHLIKSVGINGLRGDVNAPTVFNSSLNFKQFWDGRAASLTEQIDGPITNPKEMGANWADIVKKISSDPQYIERFKNLYGSRALVDAPKEAIKDAIVSFEESLVTENSRFDQYLRGNRKAMSSRELSGYGKFKSYGCISCHQGVNVGGNMFQTMGVMGDYFKSRGTKIEVSDLGRFNVTKNENDKFVFRVPSLRNVAMTAPYFHDGSAKSLDEAIKVMAKYQLGRHIPNEDLVLIIEFLNTLTGEVPESIIQNREPKNDS